MKIGNVCSDIKTDMLSRIFHGELLPGKKIPSIRESALYYEANPNTVSKAYQSLNKDGIIEKKRTNGYYVVENEKYIENVKELDYL